MSEVSTAPFGGLTDDDVRALEWIVGYGIAEREYELETGRTNSVEGLAQARKDLADARAALAKLQKYTAQTPVIRIGIHLDGGVIQSIFSNADGVEIECIAVDYDVDSDDLRGLSPIKQDDGSVELARVYKEPVSYLPDDVAVFQEAADYYERKKEPGFV